MISKWKIILFSLIIGAVYLLPHILFKIEMKGNYKIFFASEEEENEVYTARIREVYDGHYYITDPYIYENKSKPYARAFLPPLISGIFGRIFNLSILQLFIMSNFIFPIFIFLLISYFLFILTKSQNLSLLGSFFILLTDFPESIYFLIRGLNLSPLFSRLINPLFNFTFFILCLIFTYKALHNIKISFIFLGGLFFGLLFHSDPYFWSYVVVSYFILSIYLISKKSFRQLKALIFIILAGLLISMPYWANVIKVSGFPYFSEVITRHGLYHSYQPTLVKLYIVSILSFSTFYKNRDFNFYFIGSLLIGGFLCMNQQVISGRKLGSHQWYSNMANQITVIAGIVLLNNLLQRISQKFDYKRFKKIFLIFFFCLLIASGFYIQLSYYENTKGEVRKKQFLYHAFMWLNDNTETESVVLADDPVSLILPVYTHNNVYIARYIFESLVSDSEIMDRFFIFARLWGMDEEEIIAYIKKHRFMFFGVRPGDPKYKNDEDFFILNRIFENASKKYRYFEKTDILALLKRFRVDYIFYSPYEKEISRVDLNKYPFLYKVYDKGDVQIFKIIR